VLPAKLKAPELAPNAGAEAAPKPPKAGLLAAPKAGALKPPKREGALAGVPPPAAGVEAKLNDGVAGAACM
jgi:hypothetical protein